MFHKSRRHRGIFRAGRLLIASLFLLLVPIFVACSDDGDSAAPTSAPVATAAPTATTEPAPTPVPPTEAPATATPEPPAPTPTTAAPTATTAPTMAPTATQEPEPTEAPSDSGIQTPDAEELYNLVEKIAVETGYRVSGTPQEEHAAEYLKEHFEDLGYSAELLPFTYEHFNITGFAQGQFHLANIEIISPVQMNFLGYPLTTTPGGATGAGELVIAPLDAADQAEDTDVQDKVALVQIGEISLADPAMVQKIQDRVNELGEAGAVAAIVDGTTASGIEAFNLLFGVPSLIPALLIPSGGPGEGSPISQIPPGIQVVASVQIQTDMLTSNNVIAELEGDGEGVVVIGAHYDIVPDTELGFNDNASGTAVVLSLAKALADQSLPYTVRFMLFGAEEQGLYGSKDYVASLSESELAEIKAMINFDVVGTGEYIEIVGADPLASLALDSASDLGIDARLGTPPPGAYSDHMSFEAAGVSVLMVFAPDYHRIHTIEDKLEFVQPERLVDAFNITQAVIMSPDFAAVGVPAGQLGQGAS